MHFEFLRQEHLRLSGILGVDLEDGETFVYSTSDFDLPEELRPEVQKYLNEFYKQVGKNREAADAMIKDFTADAMIYYLQQSKKLNNTEIVKQIHKNNDIILKIQKQMGRTVRGKTPKQSLVNSLKHAVYKMIDVSKSAGYIALLFIMFLIALRFIESLKPAMNAVNKVSEVRTQIKNEGVLSSLSFYSKELVSTVTVSDVLDKFKDLPEVPTVLGDDFSRPMVNLKDSYVWELSKYFGVDAAVSENELQIMERMPLNLNAAKVYLNVISNIEKRTVEAKNKQKVKDGVGNIITDSVTTSVIDMFTDVDQLIDTAYMISDAPKEGLKAITKIGVKQGKIWVKYLMKRLMKDKIRHTSKVVNMGKEYFKEKFNQDAMYNYNIYMNEKLVNLIQEISYNIALTIFMSFLSKYYSVPYQSEFRFVSNLFVFSHAVVNQFAMFQTEQLMTMILGTNYTGMVRTNILQLIPIVVSNTLFVIIHLSGDMKLKDRLKFVSGSVNKVPKKPLQF